ncbi:PAS domain S-box protein [Nostoc sp. FACHB-110]|uniref:sensor histidine kinase n=1 Tax=Nostoc sp. FACHB-110 TaxID=2692834 RepID=UPI0016877611|nr:PAS domain S-box protein [Nostoc sp. FACHB-110]MBD2435663.1 PAS domain S-box protein [Nostoc sp. FACHB-110]
MNKLAPSLISLPHTYESGVLLQLADGSIQACNQTAEKILGLTLKQIQGWNSTEPPWQAIHADGTPFPGDTHPAMVTLDTGKPCNDVVMGLYQPCGKLVWILIQTEPLWADGCTPYGVIATFADVTEQMGLCVTDPSLELQSSPSMNNQKQNTAVSGSEEAFFFERSLDLLSVVGIDGYFKRANPAFTKILGYCTTELLGSPFLNFVHPDDHTITLAEMEKLKAGMPTLNFENRYRTKEGSYRWLSWTASPQLDQGVIYCVARDMTRQKETEKALEIANEALEKRVAERTAQLEQLNAALRESEERNQLAMEVARIFTFEWECNSDAVKRSPQCGIILGLSAAAAEQDTGSNFFQRVHPEDRERFIAGIQALTPQKNTYKTTYRVICPNGQIVTLEEIGRALFNQQGQLTKLIGITADVTERQRLEAQLRESQATLQRQLAEIETIYQSAPIGLNILDTDLRFVRINQRLAEINGFTVEEHIGRTVRELLPNIADTAEEVLRSVLETGEPLLNVEIRGETPAQPGVERVWLEKFLPLKDGDRVIGISTVCEEITERKAIETQREKLLQQEQAARAAAERANRSKDEFLSILSHELRTPLNPILGWATLLQSPKLKNSSEKIQEGLSIIERNAKQQLQLISDLLDVSQIMRGQLSLNFAAVNLSQPITAALETVRLAAAAKAIELEVLLDPLVGQVRGDAGRLQQVFWNLLSNAVKFTPLEGKVTVQLTCVGRYAQIQVSDTGKGIQPEFLPFVFDLFQQQDSSTTRAFGGLGLGLAIARQVVEAHGGKISVVSAGEGQGATFTVQLPLISVV